uniref:NBS-LRR n=1 Tax=Gossypium hirsutum TaxID=3635 RepID=I1X3V3_GOSHI|nr:NBS-LRR [Gossypium hirsutum]
MVVTDLFLGELVQKLCQDPDVKEKFKDNIFYVTVSKVHNLKLIVRKLFEHNGFRVPEFQTDEDAINQLEQLLKSQARKAPVWCGSESLLAKFKFQISESKVLVTSRNEFLEFGSTYDLELPLTDKDALTLFHRSAFLPNTSCNIPDDLQIQIVNCCKRFPLAITTVGMSLRNQPVEKWRIKLTELSKGSSILDSEQKLLALLKSCLDDLNQGHSILDSNIELLTCFQKLLHVLEDNPNNKECFMDLGLFPEDQRIPLPVLIDIWAVLYGFDDDGIEAMDIINKLDSMNLVLKLVPLGTNEHEDGFYNDFLVTQHDILRELAICQSEFKENLERKRLNLEILENTFPDWCLNTINASLLSISTDDLFSSKWWLKMEFPKAEVLIVNFSANEYFLPPFIENMPKLRALIVINHSTRNATLHNFSAFSNLANLRSLWLEKVSIKQLTESTIPLRSLRKISLILCKINNSLDQVEIFPSLCINFNKLPSSICRLHKLNSLSITNCDSLYELPSDLGELQTLQVLRIYACPHLKRLPPGIGHLVKLKYLDISQCVGLRCLPEAIGCCRNLEKIDMRECPQIDSLPSALSFLESLRCVICDDPRTALSNMKSLRRVICDDEVSWQWRYLEKTNPNLYVQVAEKCYSLDWLDG